MSGIMKLLAAIAIVIVAGLALLLVFDVISFADFGKNVKKVVLTGAILALASAALAFIMKGKD